MSQPNPFRSFPGAAAFALPPRPDAPEVADDVSPLTAAIVGNVLRYALGLSAWKQFGQSRWSLRVNPSSGNLHPTEAYVVAEAVNGLSETAAVYHYAADRHQLERRCAFTMPASSEAIDDPASVWLVALTSIHWREAWKYGERAFRYCQHDLGHAIAAVRIAADLVGWRAAIAPEWSHRDIATLTGIDRGEDFVDAEREEPGCVLAVFSRQSSVVSQQSSVERRDALVDAVRRGQWTGRANQLSDDHVQWTFIDDIAAATRDSGRRMTLQAIDRLPDYPTTQSPDSGAYPARVLLARRSAVSLDGRSSIDASRFFAMLARVMPGDGSPWDALWWDARIHLALFVHRVDGIDPGLYLLPRNASTAERLKKSVRQDFSWEPVTGEVPLVRLACGDYRPIARRVSCDQDIAADGFFSLGMIADFDASLDAFGPSFYRQLFWESGVVGQVLYLEAEAAGARATGIGCFYDDPVHDVFGFAGHAFQSLYHFTVGIPVEDTRLTTEPGYSWDMVRHR